MMEYKITRLNNNPDWAYAQGFEYAIIEFKKNGKTIELDDAHKKMLLDEIDPLKMGEIKGDAYFVAFPLKCFEEDDDYDEEEAGSILEDYYVTPAQKIFNLFTETTEDEVEFTEEDEEAFRENVASMVTDDLTKLNTIRLGYYENFTSNVKYQQELFNDTFIDDCIDEIVDAILENDEAYLSKESAKGFINADIDHVAGFYENIASDKTASDSERRFADKVFTVLCHYDLDKALTLLEKGMNDSESMSVSFDNVSEVIEATVRPHGNGARVMIPKKYIGKNVKIVIKKQD